MPRWKKVLIGAGAGIAACLLATLLAGPPILSSVIRSRLTETIQQDTTGTVEIADVDFSWLGPVEIEGLVLRDRHGEIILDAPRSRVDGSIWNGYSDVRVTVDSPTAVVRQYADGTWNWKEIRREKQPSEPKEPSKKKRDSRAEITIINARIILTANGRRSELVANGSATWEKSELRYRSTTEGLTIEGDLDDLRIDAKDFAIAKLRGLYDVPDLKANGSATFHVADIVTGKGRFDLGPDAGLSFELNHDIFVDGFAQLETLRPGWKGRAEGTVRLDRNRAVTRVTVTNFEAAGVSDPKVTIEADGDFVRSPLDVTIRDAKISSTFLRTQARGRVKDDAVHLEGDLWYVPEKVDAVFELPGEFVGTREEQITFAFDSPLRPRDFLQFIRGTSGRGTFGLGEWRSKGLDLAGRVETDAREGVVQMKGALDVNLGRADVTATVDYRNPFPDYRVSATFRGVSVDPSMSEFLRHLHPLLVADAGLEGSVELSYVGDFAPEKLNGRGSFRFSDIVVRDAPLLREMGVVIDTGTIEMDPIEISLREGRVTYEKPLRMKLGRQTTTWSGSIGVDGSLDFAWEIPVGPKLIAKYPVLERVAGETIRIPVRGTIDAPQVMWQAVVEDLVKKAAEREIEKRADDWFGDVLGSRDEGAAQKLLDEADRLWNEGKTAEAAPKYREIREKHRKTKVYDRNKDRIKQRMGS